MPIKNPLKTILFRIVNSYRGSSVRPFKSILRKFYLKYIQGRMRENKTILAEIDGIKYELNLSTLSRLETYYGGGYEPAVIKIMKKYVKPGMTVFDVGANIGLHTFRLKKLVGKEGIVVAVEPDKSIFEILKRNEKLNNCSIIAENIAFSDKNTDTEMTMDRYIDGLRVDRVDFMKIDTEGYEYKIIKGGRETLKKFKPVMVMEFSVALERWGDNVGKLVDLLGSLGYRFFRDKSLEEHPNKQSILNEVAKKKFINVLCK